MRAYELLSEAVKQRLDPKCWKGYKKQGTKVKGGVRVNNCVKEELEEEFDTIEEIVEHIAESNGVDPEVVWEDLSTLTDDELYVFAVTSNTINEYCQKANKRDKTD